MFPCFVYVRCIVCGIVGMKLLNQDHAKEAMAFVEQLLIQSEIRGKHATGFATLSRKGTGHVVSVTKNSIPASEFVKSSNWRVLHTLPPRALIAHTRYSTSGDWKENDNNQPISLGCLAIVHNGLVSMATRPEYEPEYEVSCRTDNDSEIILQKVLYALTHTKNSKYGEDRSKLVTQSIANGLRDIHKVDPPIFACGFLDSDGNIYAVRDHIRPLWFVYIKSWGFIGFASTRDIINRALKTTDLTEDDGVAIWEADPYTVYKLGPGICKDAIKLEFSYPKEYRFQRPNLVYHQWLTNRRCTNKGKDLRVDNGKTKDYRKNMRECFKHYSVAAITSWEIDPAYPLLNYIFRRYEFSKSQEYWACWLYGVFYHPGSVFFVLNEFPEFEKVDIARLTKWHSENWQKLRYNTDRKWEKGHFVEMFISYRDLIGGQHPTAQEDFFTKLLTNQDPVKNFHQVFGKLRGLTRFGRYSIYILTEAYMRCMGMPIQADTVFLKEAASPRAGLCYALNKADWAKAKLTQEEWTELEEGLETLMTEIQEEYPEVPIDYWFMESCLCSWKGYWRSTKGRYIGYYLSRMADEILQMQETDITCGVDWKVLWQFRRECLMWELLGEYQRPPQLSIQKSMEHVMRDTGHMIGVLPFIKRGILVSDEVYSNEIT